MNTKHKPVCLKLVPDRDLNIYKRRRGMTRVLKVAYGGSMLSSKSVTFCGLPVEYARDIVPWKDRKLVTCSHCRRNMDHRFPVQVNPRSGMAMPRPAANRGERVGS